MVEITKAIVARRLEALAHAMLGSAEVRNIRVGDVLFQKDEGARSLHEKAQRAVEESYHDILSDVDLHVRLRLPSGAALQRGHWVALLSRFGIRLEDCLGLACDPKARVCRVIQKDGMRYDFVFEIEKDENAQELPNASIKDARSQSLADADRFWFVQIQALAKLYRQDFLIGDHLANMNLNETLVLQMQLRDAQYGTNHHRYGYAEELEYVKCMEEPCPFHRENATFNRIAEKLHAASLAYDNLAGAFVPGYGARRHVFFDIWACYDREIR